MLQKDGGKTLGKGALQKDGGKTLGKGKVTGKKNGGKILGKGMVTKAKLQAAAKCPEGGTGGGGTGVTAHQAAPTAILRREGWFGRKRNWKKRGRHRTKLLKSPHEFQRTTNPSQQC